MGPRKQQALSYSTQLLGLVLPLKKAFSRARRNPLEERRGQLTAQTRSVCPLAALAVLPAKSPLRKPPSLWSPARALIPSVPTPPSALLPSSLPSLQLRLSVHSVSTVSGSRTTPIASLIGSAITLSASTLFSPRSPRPYHHWVHCSVPSHPRRSSPTVVFPSPSSLSAVTVATDPIIPISITVRITPSPPPCRLSPIVSGSLLWPHPYQSGPCHSPECPHRHPFHHPVPLSLSLWVLSSHSLLAFPPLIVSFTSDPLTSNPIDFLLTSTGKRVMSSETSKSLLTPGGLQSA